MSTTLSNITFSNNEYIVTGSNPSGFVIINQPTTASYYMQFSAYVGATYLHSYTATIADTTSNLTIAINGSNLTVSNKTSNMFSNFVPYIQPMGYNVLGINRYDDSVIITINNSNIVRITSSNELPQSFSNSYIKITSSNAGKFTNIAYNPIGVTNSPMEFKKPVKFVSSISASNVTACNISSLSNQLVATSNVAYFASNIGIYSSNNLVKKSGDVMTGNLRINNGQIGDAGHGATWTAFSHSNTFNTVNYALLQNNVGRTILNCATGQSINFRIANVDNMIYTSNGLGIGTTTPANKLDVIGVIYNAVTGGANATFTPTNILKCDPSSAYFYWRNSNLGLDVSSTSNNLATNKRHIIINEYADSTSGFVGIGTSSPAHKLDVAGNVNAFTFSGSNISACNILNLSNQLVATSNVTFWNSNNLIGLSNLVTPTLTSTSNVSFWTSNALISYSNSITPTITSTSNISAWNSNTLTNFSNYITPISISASNTAFYSSNAVASVNNSLVSFSNFESSRVDSLSNYAYNIQTSNSVINNFYTSNIITKTINASDGGTIGSLVMSTAGLLLGGYNLLNQNGKLVNSLTDTLGRLNINPNGSVEFQSLLSKTSRFTDSVQIGVSTLEMSNDAIYFKNSNTSNTIISSNAITVTNPSLTTFTISNVHVFTNCNVHGSNISNLSNQVVATSNVAFWNSNALISFSNFITPISLYGSNVTTWTSNNSSNAYLKTGGNITGNVGIKTSVPAYELDVTGNIRLMRGPGNPTTLYINPTNSANTLSFITFVNDGHYILCADSNYNNMTRPNASGHNMFYVSGGHYFNGAVFFNSTLAGPTINNLSNMAMYSSNVATFASNNNINRTTDFIGNFYTNNIVLQNSLNIIGSGWEWSNGWRAYSQYGGYVLRNGQNGGLQFWTGTSNNGLGHYATLTSNGNFGIGTSTPTVRLEVGGNVKVQGDGTNPLCFILSNNNSPSVSVWSSNSSMEVGVSSISGGYSADATVGSAVIRCSSNLFIQSGVGASAICVNSNNNVGIRTKNPIYPFHCTGTGFFSNIISPSLDALSNSSINIQNSAFYASNTAVYSSNVAIWSSNLATDTYYKTEWTSNLTTSTYYKAEWSSNTVNWTSNNFGLWRGNTTFAMPDNTSYFYNQNVNLPFQNYALMQYSNGLTEINGSACNGVIICDKGAIIASFSNNTMEMNGGNISTYGLQAWSYTTLKRGSSAGAGTYTHFPYSGDQKNYIRGTTIMGDTSPNEKIGIGTIAPAYKLEVAGATRLSSLIVGSHTDETKSIRHYSVQIPPSSTKTTTFDVSGSFPYPDLFCVVYAQIRSSAETITDVFATSVLAITSSNIKFSICRVDTNTGWGQYPWLDFCVVGM